MATASTAKLTFAGAARGVTGSCYHLETPDGALVIDCGTFQGGKDPDAQNRAPFPFEPERVSAAVLTHGHLDHCGRLPLLAKSGFAGPVFGHAATLEIARLIMDDTAKIGLFAGKKPMYDNSDVERTMARTHGLAYGQKVPAGPFSIQLFDAGHILGSSSVRVSWQEGGDERAILFSGDLGVLETPIIRDPNSVWDPEGDLVDFVVTESTYGSRNHPGRVAAREAFRNAVLHAVTDGGKVLIPAFAIGRTQEVLYELNHLVENRLLVDVPVIVDGPLGLDATRIYDHYKECYDEEALDLIRSGDMPLEFPGLFGARKGRSSAAAKEIDGPAIIVAGSGMCSGGRIRGYMADYLSDSRTDVIFVGYQAQGTLGRDLQAGHDTVTIDNREIDVRAVITTIGGLSAHADQSGLSTWFERLPRKPGGAVFVTHGEEKASRAYGRLLRDKFGARSIIPALGDTAALTLRPTKE
jgi:metallo-beta-lactamase family protein